MLSFSFSSRILDGHFSCHALLALEAFDLLLRFIFVDASVKECHAEDAEKAEKHAQNFEHAQLLAVENGREKGLVEGVSAHEGLSRSSEPNSHADCHENTAKAHEPTSSHTNGKVFPCDFEVSAEKEREKEHGEDEELKDGCVESLFDAIVLGLELANEEVLSGDNGGTAQAKNDSQDSIHCLAATAALLKLIIGFDLATVATSCSAYTNHRSDHKYDADQMEVADFLSEAKVKGHDVDQAS